MKIKPSSTPGKVVMEVGKDEAALTAAESRKARRISLEKILVPIDLSAASHKALKYAASFSDEFKAEVTLLHVIEPPLYPPELGYTPAEFARLETSMLAEAKNRLEEIARTELATEIPVRVEVKLGHTFQTIDAFARSERTDLIIVTTHGYTGLKHMLMGSTAEKIVRYAPCPVMVVRNDEHDFV